ncbi:MAG: L-threonylcarbamoyladenylate synthase [Mariprofundaceae bacterium]|nr:L-threonylcarbamoyladenylate synthase [Mariprofundaceae bacterium]
MFELLRLHPERPQQRHIARAVQRLQQGWAVIVPTDSSYAFMCLPDAFEAQERICRLRGLDKHHLWSLVCHNLSQVSQYVNMDNVNHRIMRSHLPGPYTFILPASRRLAKRIFGKRRDIGIRMPCHAVCDALLATLNQPLLATTLQFVDEPFPAIDPDDFMARINFEKHVVLDAGWGGVESTTVVDLCDQVPVVVREGLGVFKD